MPTLRYSNKLHTSPASRSARRVPLRWNERDVHLPLDVQGGIEGGLEGEAQNPFNPSKIPLILVHILGRGTPFNSPSER